MTRKSKLLARAIPVALAFSCTAAAQRVGFPPLDAPDRALALAVPSAVTRALESIDGLSAPAPADLAVYLAGGPEAEKRLNADYLLDYFIDGKLAGAAGGYTLTLAISSPKGNQTVEVKGSDFAGLVKNTDAALVKALALKPTAADAKELAAVEGALPAANVAAAAASASASNLGILEGAADNPWALTVRAAYAAAAGDGAKAVELADRAANLAPLDVNVQTAVAATALVANKFDLARTAADAALKLNPWKSEAHYVKGAVILKSKSALTVDDLKAAGNEFGRALQANPRLLDAGLDLAEVLDQLGATDSAINQLSPLVPRFPDEPRLHAKIISLYRKTRPDYATRYLQDLLAAHPDDQPAVYSLALGLLDTDAAMQIVKTGETRYPGSADLIGARGRLLERQGRYAEAADAYSQSLAKGANGRAAGTSLAIALAKAGKPAEAQAAIDKAEGGKAAAISVARVFAAAGLTDRAEEAVKTLAGSNADAAYLSGAIALREGRPDDADKAFDVALRLNPKYLAARDGKSQVVDARLLGVPSLDAASLQLYRIGLASLDVGEVQEAITAFTKVAKANPKSLQANTMLGVTLSQSGDPDAAVDALQAALALAPKNALVLTNLGAAQMDTGRYDLAIATLESATTAAPTYGRAWFYLGLANYKLGLPDRAVSNLKKAQQVDPTLADDVKPFLDSLGAK